MLSETLSSLAGVQSVVDQRTYLDQIFQILNAASYTAIGIAALMLVAAALLIATTIRLSAFSRRRELGIMRLVGASNRFIQTPFVLEGVFAALIGSVLAAGADASRSCTSSYADSWCTQIVSINFVSESDALVVVSDPAGRRGAARGDLGELRHHPVSQGLEAIDWLARCNRRASIELVQECAVPRERGQKVVATNRKARHDYTIEDTYEAGLVLTGTEVKSLRAGRAPLVDGYAFVDGGEAWLDAVHIPEYADGTWNNHAATAQAQTPAAQGADPEDPQQGQGGRLHARPAVDLLQRRPREGRDSRSRRASASTTSARRCASGRTSARPTARCPAGGTWGSSCPATGMTAELTR